MNDDAISNAWIAAKKEYEEERRKVLLKEISRCEEQDIQESEYQMPVPPPRMRMSSVRASAPDRNLPRPSEMSAPMGSYSMLDEYTPPPGRTNLNDPDMFRSVTQRYRPPAQNPKVTDSINQDAIIAKLTLEITLLNVRLDKMEEALADSIKMSNL